MHVLIIDFNLRGIGEEHWLELAESVAPAFAAMPGLISKTWLANKETNTYGGVYVWQNGDAMERYKKTDTYKGMLSNPHFEGGMVTDFAVLEDPTRTTRGLAETVA